jgi:hypothetical protein
MGEMADFINDQWDIFGDDPEPDPVDWLDYTDEQLVKESSFSRKPLVMAIRKYYKENKKLSEKQRYCLASAICYR